MSNYNKNTKRKGSAMARLDGESYFGFKSDAESDIIPPALRTRLRDLFSQIEKEFEVLYAENLSLQEKVDCLNEKLERESFLSDRQGYESVDLESTTKPKHKSLTAASSGHQKLKTAHKQLRAQTSRIVSSLKGPTMYCRAIRELVGHRDGVWEVTTAKGGHLIGTASADHTACIWSAANGSALLQYAGHSGSVNSIRFHGTRDLALTASGDNTAHVWQAAVAPIREAASSEDEVESETLIDGDLINEVTCETLRTPVCRLTGHSGAVAAADWLCGGEQVITASWDRTAAIYDAETAALIVPLSGHDLELTHCSAHQTQKLALTSSRDSTFRLWDLRDSAQQTSSDGAHAVAVFQGHTGGVTSALFVKDDRVVSGSDDRTVKVWDLRNMRSPLATIRATSGVNRLAVTSLAGGLIAIPHDDRHVRVFDLSGQRIGRLPHSSRCGHRRMVAAAAWTDELSAQANLYTCGFDRRVIAWEVRLGAT